MAEFTQSFYQHLKNNSHRAAYDMAEIEWIKSFGKRRYSNFRSFKSSLCRKLGKRKKSTLVV